MSTIKAVTHELHKAFELLNERFFENKLPTPAITIQTSRHNKLSMGWCSVRPIWSDKKGEIKLYEINISAEYVNYDFFETMDTLMHEMVHLYNNVHDIQDCSRNETYHNKHFKERAIKSGFEYENDKPDPKYGWSFAKLSQETKDIISKMDIDQSVFTISRRMPRYLQPEEPGLSDPEMNIEPEMEEFQTAAKKTTWKWTCPKCNLIVRSTKPHVNIKCGDCELTLLGEDD
ncbi:SprT-like domain-containing protein [Bacillus cereus group sp. BfR-BA-01347]|uniref:SprT-like domain-containing protein n=1 Tax=Bacillus cereus group sp. BfR-BA-01347 TaxID=2920310 RepID=UPI001F578B79|nr:SprT-like domain-containing protein [Bacillus cereus group sp. BfR-BA-01347]